MRSKILIISFALCFLKTISFAQKPGGTTGVLGQDGKAIPTAVPFLMVSPDARSGGLGDIGAATSADPFSQHWNPAKYPYLEDDLSISLTYSPWLLNLVPDMSLAYLTAAKKIDPKSTIAFSLLFFSMGEVMFRTDSESDAVPFNPNEFAIDASYSRMLIDDLSIGITGRFIYSNLTLGQHVGTEDTKAALAGAVDIGLFYTTDFIFDNNSSLKGGTLNFGFSITNIGNKMSYSNDAQSFDKHFLPTNLRIGLGFDLNIDDYNKISFFGEINKLLVPSEPYYDSASNIIAGMNPDVGVITGIFQSFYDAPNGFKEEMQEIQWSLATEYWYRGLVAVRAGYFHESKNKGYRQYITLGAGIRYNIFGLDLSYLIPTTSQLGTSPLKNTLRFSLIFNIASTKPKNRAETLDN